MLSPLRNRFGIPGVISVAALVFAMIGGAYAASDSSGGGKATASAKAKRGPKGPKGATGPTGPAGPVGPSGPVGPKGADGEAGQSGSAGADGADGQDVAVEEILPFEDCEEQAGARLKSASGENVICDGEDGTQGVDGSPWVVDQVPSGALMKGTWTLPQYTATAAGQEMPVAVSTGVPIAPPPGTYYSVLVPPGGNPEFSPFCNGSADNPTVEGPGIFCLYAKSSANVAPMAIEDIFEPKLVSSGGGVITMLKSSCACAATAYGSWAFKAE